VGSQKKTRASWACALISVACAGNNANKESEGPPDPPPAALLDAVDSVFPANNAEGVCADLSLLLNFSEAVALGSSGSIEILSAADPETPVFTLDMGAEEYRALLGLKRFYLERPVYVSGSSVTVRVPAGTLTPETAYFVAASDGVFLSDDGENLGPIEDSSAWSFETGSGVPASETRFEVNQDGSGDFCSIQGAVDAIPGAHDKPIEISIAAGTYHEIVSMVDKLDVTLSGEDAETTIISYPNNDVLQRGLGTKFRAMVHADNVTNLTIENLTFHNTTVQGGSQAEALRVEPGNEVILRNSRFLSLQDTLLLTGTIYGTNLYIEGNVDFLWGTGSVFIEDSEIRTVGRPGYMVQARNIIRPYGFVFKNSRFTASPENLSGHYLGRIEADRFPDSNVAYINCQFGEHIHSAGWLVTSGTPTERLRFWEYSSSDLSGEPLDISERAEFSRQLTEEEALEVGDVTVVLDGWNPNP
jgi:hypothetical protein